MECLYRHPEEERQESASMYGRESHRARFTSADRRGDHCSRYVNQERGERSSTCIPKFLDTLVSIVK